jgi:hypothetical protein
LQKDPDLVLIALPRKPTGDLEYLPGRSLMHNRSDEKLLGILDKTVGGKFMYPLDDRAIVAVGRECRIRLTQDESRRRLGNHRGETDTLLPE